MILLLKSHLCLLFSISLLLDLFLLYLLLQLPLLLLLPLALLDLLLALMNPILVGVVEAALASRLDIDVEDVILLLQQTLSQVMAVYDLSPAVNYEALLDLRIVRHRSAPKSVG